ncbi:MAG: hypothetical protein Q7R84_03485 [bacterium]|nr:hypothetical protein [bacterium]
MGTEKVTVTRGIYAGVLDSDTGKLLLMRRTKTDSIIPGVSFKGNRELPGGAIMASNDNIVPYNYYLQDLVRLLKEKTGIVIVVRGLPVMYSVFLKGPAGYDEASVIPLVSYDKPTIGDTIYVSPYELRTLTEEFEPADEKTGKSGKGLLSGYGKRMHCMALLALSHSPNRDFVRQAMGMLDNITVNWT